MSPRLHFYIVTLFLIVALSPLGVLIVDNKQAEYAHKADSFTRTTAFITLATQVTKRRGGTSINFDYVFMSADGIKYTGSGTMTPAEWQTDKGALPIEIYYDPNNPNRNSTSMSVDLYAEKRPLFLRLSVGAFITSLPAVAIGVAWSWFVARRRKQVQ